MNEQLSQRVDGALEMLTRECNWQHRELIASAMGDLQALVVTLERQATTDAETIRQKDERIRVLEADLGKLCALLEEVRPHLKPSLKPSLKPPSKT